MKGLTFESAVELRNGVKMPLIGYSTEEHAYSHRTEYDILRDAIELGYRYFELSYEDDCLVPLRKAIEKSGIPREEFFVSIKIGEDENRLNSAPGAINEILEQFGGGYLDLITMPWPFWMTANAVWSGNHNLSKTANGHPIGLQDVYNDKIARAVGVCNFDIKHLEALKEYPFFSFLPMVNLNQFHPLYTCKALREYCKENQIQFVKTFETNRALEAKKPVFAVDVGMNGDLFEISERERRANELTLGVNKEKVLKALEEENPFYVESMRRQNVLEKQSVDPFDPACNPRSETDFYAASKPLAEIAKKYGKTNRQMIDRWALQHGAIVLIKGIWKEEMERGKDLFDFVLSEEEMAQIDSFNMEKRFGFHPDYIDF